MINKFFQYMSTLDQKKQFAVLAAILFGAFLVDYFTLMQVQLGRLRKIVPQVELRSKEYNSSLQEMKKFDQYKAEVERLKKQSQGLNTKIKSKQELPLILENISRLANRSNVEVDRVTPNFEAQDVLLSKGNRKYYTLPIFFEIAGSYHNFGRFLNQLEADKSITLKDFSINVNPKDPAKHLIRITMHLIIFEEI